MNKPNIFLKIILLLVIVYLIIFSIKWVPKITHGFTSYYTFSYLMLQGEDLSKAYDDDYFRSKIKEKGIDVSDILASNIPTNTFALAPFAWLEPKTARIVWSLFSLLLFFISIYVLFKTFRINLNNSFGIIILIIILLWRPLYENIALAQLYCLLLFLFSLCLYALSKENKFASSFTLSLVFLFKGYGIVNFIWLAVKRKWKMLALAISFVIAGIVLSMLIIGSEVWLTYLADASAKLGKLSSMGHVAYQTLNSLFMHLFVYDKTWLPHPVFILPRSVVFILSLLVNLALVMYVVTGKIQNNKQMLASFSAAIAAGVVTAPIAEEYHYLLFVPLLIGLADYFYTRYLEHRNIGLQEKLFLIAVLVMIFPLNYKALQNSVFPVYLLAYFKLYAGLILLYLFRKLQKEFVNERYQLSES